MRLARVVGTVTATVKDRAFAGHRFLIVDLVDPAGNVLEAHHVAADAVGAGTGDLVLVTSGSAARQAQRTVAIPADLAIVMIVDEIAIGGQGDTSSKQKKGK